MRRGLVPLAALTLAVLGVRVDGATVVSAPNATHLELERETGATRVTLALWPRGGQ
jgi:hypothetical protein